MQLYTKVIDNRIRSRRYMKHFDIDDIILMMFKGYRASYIARQFNVSHALIIKRLEEYNIEYKKLKKLCATFRAKSL